MSPRRVWGPAQAWPRLHTCAARVHHLSLPEVPRACVVYWYRSIWGFGLAKCSKAGVDEKAWFEWKNLVEFSRMALSAA